MQKDLHAIWQGILGEVELTLSTPNYAVYWAKTKLVSYDSNEAIFEVPNDLPDFVYETSPYPIGENNIRQLEIITFQHIAPKLGMPVDLLNNGMDETKNANVNKQVQQSEQQQEQQ